jgi:hypothetical protein
VSWRGKANSGRPAASAGLAVAFAAMFGVAEARLADRGSLDCDIPDAELEASGAVVGEIHIDNLNIFDLANPKEDKALFRLMNRLHVLTRPSVIQRQLLFAPGEPFRRRLLDESERILRATGYLHDAQIYVDTCEAGVVNISVHTQDVWTLKPGIYMSRSGGENRSGVDFEEENFLGRGGSVRFSRRTDEERRSTEVGYRDRNLGGRWIAIDVTVADNSDGHLFDFGLERPFYSFDTRRAGGGRILDEKREDKVYALGDEVGKYRLDVEYFDLYGGLSAGMRDGWVNRWLAGVVYDNRSFENVQQSLDPLLVPGDRRLMYPYVGFELVEDRYQRAENLDQIRRTEDVSLGASVNLRLGLLARGLGSDRKGAIFSAEANRGFGDPARLLWSLSAHVNGRVESGKAVNTVFGGTARWYLRESERWLLFATVYGDVAKDLDLDNPLEIGGDVGLRGYPLRYQRGNARAQFTIEQRYFTDYYLWRLFRVGGAVFFDAGRVWGRNPYGGENLGLLKDFGFGLRLSNTRSSIGKMIHIDFAFPLDGDPSISNFQVLMEGKRSF